MTAVDEIKARIDIVDLVSETVQLRRSGKNYTGFCPFHSNTRTPAFVVFPETGTWRCFGQCNEGGDAFGFVMKREGWDFQEALQYLAERTGVELKPPTPEEQSAAEENEHLRNLLEDAVTYYRHQLLNTKLGLTALEYLRQKRGLKDDTIEAFSLGYASNSWDATIKHLLSKGHTLEEMLAAGLISERDSGGYYDRFRHRVMFPIRDGRGRMAGFGARILNPEDVPKFLNSPQTGIFDKGRLLYGLDLARKAIRTEDRVVIVEGYLDVIALHQAGFTNAVSPMGTALTEYQLHQMKRFSRRIVLALDPDAAGDKATLRGLQVARQAMDREQDPVFDARGLLGHEARLQADIRVSTLPDGLDPDEVVNRDPAEWERLIDNARPIVIHVMETLGADQNLDDPKVKSEIAEQVLPLIADVPNPVERDTYRQRLARFLRVDERALIESAPSKWRRPGRRRWAKEKETPAQNEVLAVSIKSTSVLEEHCLGVLLRRPDLLYQVDRKLRERKLFPLAPEDFQQADHQAIMRLFQESIDQDLAEPQNFVLNYLPLSMMEIADGLLARTAELDPNEQRVIEDLMRGLLKLRRWKVDQEIEYVRLLMDDTQGQDNVAQYGQTMVQLLEQRKNLDQAIHEYTSRSSVV